MATYMRRDEHKEITPVASSSCSAKPNFLQRLCMMLCGGESFPTNDGAAHDYSSQDGGSYAGFYNEQPTYKGNKKKGYEQPNQKVERSNGINGDGSEKMDYKHPENFGNSDREAERQASGSHKAGQSWENKKETSNGRPADNTREQPVKNRINSPEKPVFYSSQEDFIKEAMNKNGKYKDPEPAKVIIRSFDQQSEEQRKEGVKQEKNSENQTKIIKDDKYADASFNKDDKYADASFNKDDKYVDASFPKPTNSNDVPQIKDDKYAHTSPPPTAKSSSAPQIVRQTSFKDKKYADTSPSIKTKSSVVPEIVRQTSFKDKKYADTSPPITTKSSVVPQVVRQTSFKDKKYADTSPPITTKSSVVPQVFRQTSFKDNKYVDTNPWITTTTSGGTHKYSDTSTPTTTKTSFMQNFVRQTSFNDDDKYRNTRVGQTDVKETNFCKDDKYSDTNNPPKTSRSSVGHTSIEQQKGVSKQENYNENQVNTRPSSSMSTNISSLGQGGQNQSQKSVAKPEGSGSRQQEAIIALSNQQKGIYKQEDTNTKDKFGY